MSDRAIDGFGLAFPDHPAFERVHRVIRLLATARGPLQDRLYEAAGAQLRNLSPADFREGDERATFEAVTRVLTSAPDRRGEGVVRASTRALSDQEAERAAEAIFDLYNSLFRPDAGYYA